MRILFTIPHVYRQRGAKFQSTSMASRPEPVHGSDSAGAEVRARALTMCLTSLHQTFGIHQAHIMNITTACNDLITAEIEVVICTTTGADNLVDRLPGHMFRHHPTNAEPLLLGYECHAVLADNIGKFHRGNWSPRDRTEQGHRGNWSPRDRTEQRHRGNWSSRDTVTRSEFRTKQGH